MFYGYGGTPSMRKIYKPILLASLLGFATDAALAGECIGRTMPDSITVEGQSLVLNGMGVRKATLLRVKVYVAGLYLAAKTDDANGIIGTDQPRHLVLSFVRNVDLNDIQKAWRQGFEKNVGGQTAAIQDRIDQLQAAMTDFETGQTLAFSYVPGQGTDVIVNGQSKTTIEGADFASALISIWLGPNPPNDAIKVGLLGGECG
jgi:hypothetical protein